MVGVPQPLLPYAGDAEQTAQASITTSSVRTALIRESAMDRPTGVYASDGWQLFTGQVSYSQVFDARREILLSLRDQGLLAARIPELQSTTFFPELRDHPAITDLLPDAAREFIGAQPTDRWGEPQILLRLPDHERDITLTPHVDELPPWAPDGAYYRAIIGVSLNLAMEHEGVVAVWSGSHLDDAALDLPPFEVAMNSGDVFVMHPKVKHAGTLNLGDDIRMVVYFRCVAMP